MSANRDQVTSANKEQAPVTAWAPIANEPIAARAIVGIGALSTSANKFCERPTNEPSACYMVTSQAPDIVAARLSVYSGSCRLASAYRHI